MKPFVKYALIFLTTLKINAQTLDVPQVIQEQSQWCWAGVSKSVLDYYGYSKSQCEIADYARQMITWHNFGTVDCCQSPDSGCNYWNYAWGSQGSIEDILVHFGNIESYGYSDFLSLSQINTEISNGRPFIVRWGWNSGGGHFVVGMGKNNEDIFYMNPWFGEGLHISTHDWLINDGNHTWTHTNIITTNNLEIDEVVSEKEKISIFPNPSKKIINVFNDENINAIKIFNTNGQILKDYSNIENKSKSIEISDLENGMYYVEININQKKYYKKIIKE